MKTPQHLDSLRHGVGRKDAAAKYTFSQPRHLAVFVDSPQPPPSEAGNLQPDGVGSDVNSREGRHGGSKLVYSVGGARLEGNHGRPGKSDHCHSERSEEARS